MIKRRTAVFFILLANVILLAHAVIPHHHHQSIFCIAQSYCKADRLSHKHHHQHDSDANNTACILKQAIIIPSSQEKLQKICDNHSTYTDQDFYLASNFRFADFQPVLFSGSAVSGISSFHNSFIFHSPGLRAPPAV